MTMIPQDSSVPLSASPAVDAPHVASDPSPHVSLADLPPEILAWIIFLAIEPFDIAHFYYHQTLASVCRLWRDIIVHTPQFWVYIQSPKCLSRALRLSGTSPIYVEPLNWQDSSRVIFTDDELQEVLACRERWRSFRLELPSIEQLELAQAAFKQNLPLLEDVYLFDNTCSRPPWLIAEDAPGLRRPFLLQNAPGLRSIATLGLLPILQFPALSLYIMQIRHPPAHILTAVALRGLLATCPNLRSFEVDGVDFREGPLPSDTLAETPTKTATITMPFLERLLVDAIPVSLALPFLRSLITPSLTSFTTTWDSYYRPELRIDHNVLSKDNIIPRFVATILKNRPPKLISLQIDNKHVRVEVDDHLVLNVVDRDTWHWRDRTPRTDLLHTIVEMFDMGKYPVELLFRVRNNAMPLVKELATLPPETVRIITLIPVLRKTRHIKIFFKLFGSLHKSPDPKSLFPVAERMDIKMNMLENDVRPIDRQVGGMLRHFNRPKSQPLNVFLGLRKIFDEEDGKFVASHAQSSGMPPDIARVARFLRSRQGSGSTSSNSPSGSELDFSGYSDSDSDSAQAPWAADDAWNGNEDWDDLDDVY